MERVPVSKPPRAGPSSKWRGMTAPMRRTDMPVVPHVDLLLVYGWDPPLPPFPLTVQRGDGLYSDRGDPAAIGTAVRYRPQVRLTEQTDELDTLP